MRKVYIEIFGKQVEVNADFSLENRVGIKAKAVAKVKKEIIVPTIFNIDYNINCGKEREFTADDCDAVFKFISDTKIKRESYCTNDNLYLLIEDMNILQVRIILYIAAKLKYNSNVFEANYDEMSKELNVSSKTVMNNFVSLCDGYNQIISKTNRPKTYLINHNVIFKGKLEEFIRDYKVMYDGRKASFDDKGRVIIDKI
uniref:Replication protein n=1 Tax=Geladintestivirus 3 TaxID=3233135 RepID=A0AAU8MHF6_9CAUD